MSQLHMSLSDIAALTRVRRPVPSTWRRRCSATDQPFPPVVTTVAGEDRFEASAVVEWLEATGRGNNPEARDDVAAFALPHGVDPRQDQRLFDALAALLCLRVAAGADLSDLTQVELVALARSTDRQDLFLAREVEAVGGDVVALAALADARADAAYSSVAAFDQLQAQSFRYSITPAVRSTLAPAAHTVVIRLALALAVECGAPAATFVDPVGTGSDLVVSTVLAGPDTGRSVLCPDLDTEQGRAFRRRLRIHDIHRATLPDPLGELGPAVLLAHLSDAEPDAMLDAIDEIALQMTTEQRAVVVAPASVLVDRLRDRRLDGRRAQVLRTGRTRAMLRLPVGLVTHRSRQALAVWVLGPDHSRLEVEQRRIATADVSDEALTDLLVDLLVDDVVATMADPSLIRAHSFARARLVPTSVILATTGVLVQARSSSTTGGDAATLAVEIGDLRVGREVPDALGPLAVTTGSGRTSLTTTVGQAIEQRAIRLVPGHRDGFDLVDDGNVAVIGVAELVGGSALGDRRVDLARYLAGWAPNRVTVAGDVVFCTSPRPAALVDTNGGSAVEYPARVLRVHPVAGEGISPHVLAHDINGRPAGSRAWRSWPVRRVPDWQVADLATAMTSFAAQRADTVAHLDRLDRLASTLLTALTSGALVLEPASDLKDH